MKMSTAAPPTALHRSEELRCDVCSGGTARVNEYVDMFDDGEQVLMNGVMRDNEFYTDQVTDLLDNRKICVDQSASDERSSNHAIEKHHLQTDRSVPEQHDFLM
jgi:hypothetical protein